MNTTSHSKNFIEDFNEQLTAFSLPDRLTGSYTLCDCIKVTPEKEIYLLANQSGAHFILKKGMGAQLLAIRQEQTILMCFQDARDMAFPKCIDYWEDKDTCWLLRTYIEGTSLAEYFERRLYMTDLEITRYTLDICYLIQQLHQQKPPIIHRDVKPENFIIQKGTGILYLVDFDTARVFSPDKSRDTHLIGTPSHAAPEQFGFSQSDFRTDIYNIGKTILYLTTGSTEDSAMESGSLPRSLQKIITRCIAFSPEERYKNIERLQKDLKRCHRHITAKTSGLLRNATICMLTAIIAVLFFFLGCQYTKEPLPGEGSSPDITSEAKQQTNQNKDLRSQAGAEECNIFQYQEQLDSIILAYYSGEYDALIKHTEGLVTDLYNDKSLMYAKKEDFSKFSTLPDNFWEMMNEIDYIQIRLAYRDQRLYTCLGHYSDYESQIIKHLAFELKPTIPDPPPSNLYSYATSTPGKETTQNYYPFALGDFLSTITSAIDLQDGFEPPD